MVQLLVDGEDLVVHLTWREKAGAFHGDVRVPLTAIQSVRVPKYQWQALRGWRMAGVGLRGRVQLGTWRHGDGFDFGAVKKNSESVQFDVATGRFSRFVVSVPVGASAETEADRIAAAAGIARSPTEI